MDIPLVDKPNKIWNFCHPLAFLWYLASLSPEFFALMAETMQAGCLNLILYIDEVVPGNPLRHDKGRTLQAIYYAFAEWPDWVLCRTGAWPIFGFLRSNVVKHMAGAHLSS